MPERPRPRPIESEDGAEDAVDDGAKAEGARKTGGPAGLTQIKTADPSFDEVEFLEGARMAFEMILTAFANGDKRQLKPLLSESVYASFAREIDRREQAKERQETTLVSIVLADIVGARLEGRHAVVTVKFVSEQVNVRYGPEDTVVDGDPDHVVTITDVWTFSRDTRARDPNWELVDTRTES